MRIEKSLYIIFFALLALTIAAPAAGAATIKNASGLAGYWNFNEGVGITAGDASGNGNFGTVHGGTWVTGKVGKAVSLNGSTDYVSSNGSALPNVGTAGNVTISAWIKPNTTAGQQTVFSKGASGNCFNYGMTIIGSGLRSRNSNGDWLLGGTIVANKWQHVVVVFTATGAQGFINGVSVGTVANTTITCADNNWAMGTRAYNSTSSEYFSGAIDDVRIYNSAFSAAQVLSLYQSGTATTISSITAGMNSLAGYWNFNEGTGTKAGDASGNGNTGTLIGSTLPTWVTGKVGKALFFDGASSKVSLGKVNISTNVTVAAWVKTSSTGEIPVFSNRTTGSLYFGMTGGTFFVYYGSSMTSSITVNNNKWRYVVWTSDGATSTMYIDGVLNKQQAQARAGTIGASYIGWDSSNVTEYFPGSIDDVRVYNRVLSAAEIATLYQSGGQVVANASRNNVLTSGLIGLWSFDGKDMNWTTNQALDQSGWGNNGTLVNMSTTSSPVIGRIGQALNFNGTNNYVNLPDNIIKNNTVISVSLWFKTSSTGGLFGYQDVAIPGAPSAYIPLMYVGTDGKLRAEFWMGASTPITTSGTVNNGAWHHAILVGSTNTQSLYLDGAFVANLSGTINHLTMSKNQIGTANETSWPSGSSNPTYFQGSIDDVRIYSRALSASEVKTLYNSGQ